MKLNNIAIILFAFFLNDVILCQSSVSVLYNDIDNQLPITGQTWELYHQVAGEWEYDSYSHVGNQNPVTLITNDLYRIKVLRDIEGINKHMFNWLGDADNR